MSFEIYTLNYGSIECPKNMLTVGLDADIIIDFPYLGYYLTDGKSKILVDTGINSKYIVDGKAWAGRPAKGGEDFILRELERVGVKKEEIDTVIYTHLHNDHAGNSHLFPNAVHVFQDTEWKELLDPLPSMKIRGDFDKSIIPVFEGLKCKRVFGDIEYMEGIKLMLTPGHTAGSQCVEVETKDGIYLLAGDTIHVKHLVYGYLDKMQLMDGLVINVTPAPDNWGGMTHSSLVYDHYAWYKSVTNIKVKYPDPQFVLTGHGPSLVNKKFG